MHKSVEAPDIIGLGFHEVPLMVFMAMCGYCVMNHISKLCQSSLAEISNVPVSAASLKNKSMRKVRSIPPLLREDMTLIGREEPLAADIYHGPGQKYTATPATPASFSIENSPDLGRSNEVLLASSGQCWSCTCVTSANEAFRMWLYRPGETNIKNHIQ